MPFRPVRPSVVAALAVLALVHAAGAAMAAEGSEGPRLAALDARSAERDRAVALGRETGLPLPRFVSLKSKAVNMRVGPGRKYPIAWRYQRQGLPVEVIQEFDNWRRIRDADGTSGWVLHSLLSAKRNAIVAPWQDAAHGAVRHFLIGRHEPSARAGSAARVQPGLMASIEGCERDWCRLSAQGSAFWLERDQLWGVYPGEPID